MGIYMAPMEGLTGFVFRNAYEKFFGRIDKYFTPFIAPNSIKGMKKREKDDLCNENNVGLSVVPQILTNKSEDFLRTSQEIYEEYGYTEFNINLGCPSGTVSAKGKGAGFLAETEKLDRFLYEVYQNTDFTVSIKTRTGKRSHEEFYEILDIYNKYPVSELIIHPRIQKDFYNNLPNLDMYEYAYKNSKIKLCYNGDINTKEDYDRIMERFPDTPNVMIGRGLLSNPGLTWEIKDGTDAGYEVYKKFYYAVFDGYRNDMQEDKNLLFKMKEFWFYFGRLFPACEKQLKTIRKTDRLSEYDIAVKKIFRENEK